MNKQSTLLCAVIATGLVFPAGHAAGQQDATFDLTTGLVYSSGEFGGTDSIDELYVPISASFDFERLGFQLTVPYLQVRAPSGTTGISECRAASIGYRSCSNRSSTAAMWRIADSPRKGIDPCAMRPSVSISAHHTPR